MKHMHSNTLGVEFPFIPETNGVPLVADMSSNMFSRPFDHTKVIEMCLCAVEMCACVHAYCCSLDQ